MLYLSSLSITVSYITTTDVDIITKTVGLPEIHAEVISNEKTCEREVVPKYSADIVVLPGDTQLFSQ